MNLIKKKSHRINVIALYNVLDVSVYDGRTMNIVYLNFSHTFDTTSYYILTDKYT